MKKHLSVVVTVLVLLHCSPAQVPASQSTTGRGSVQRSETQTPPPGWRETLSKTLDLTIEGKHAEVVAIYEKWVADRPNFAEAHAMLGGAHEALARALLLSRAPDAVNTILKHFDVAEIHLRRAIELEGSNSTFMSMRSLIDLQGPGALSRPAEYERLVRDGLRRYPAEPLAHAYFIALLARKGEPIDTAVRAARAAMPKGAEARTELAGIITANVRDQSGAVAARLLAEALGLVDEALKMNPNYVYALEQKARILREQAQRASEPARAKLLTEADRVSAQAAQLQNRRR